MNALLGHAVDYAGLFPPASLDLHQSLANYNAHRRSEDAWALGSLVLPVAVLQAFEEQFEPRHLPVSVVLSAEPQRDLQALQQRQARYHLFECKLPNLPSIRPIMRELPEGARIFFEVDVHQALPDIFAAIRDAGACAKVRMGGVVASAIPSSENVAAFIGQCAQLRLPFKATAGLHHPVCNRYRLTYAADAPSATMHGFVNIIFAAAAMYFGASLPDACAMLEETDTQAFHFAADKVSWRGWSLTTAQLADVRAHFFISFGSCSFTEPIEESRALGWLA